MADWIIPLATVFATIIIAIIGAIPGIRALKAQRQQWADEEARRNAERVKTLTERDRLEQEITELVLSQARRQLDTMQENMDELKKAFDVVQKKLSNALDEIIMLKLQAREREDYHNKRYEELKRLYKNDITKLKAENKSLMDRVKELEKKNGTGPLKEP
jgi:chromosome segregation ATPase